MEKEQRDRLQKATQDARRLLEEEFAGQLLETYDINVAAGRWKEDHGAHLQAEQRLLREKLVAWIEHKEAQINNRKEALLLALREMAFTALNRFVALKLMEARELVRPCVSGGLECEGFQEFTAVAQGLLADQEASYRLYLETIFEDVSRELRALFDPRDPASLLWPKRTALLELLQILNRPELGELWIEDETLGWVYQYFNGDAERKTMRKESEAPRNSRELAVRNQFFTPRYVVEFLTDNTLGRIWYEMRQGNTGLKDRCSYLLRRPNEIWLQPGEQPPAELANETVPGEALSQEELMRQPVHIPHRPTKDPREIRMLDPACGSMHFGLYAFDLYVEIYEEAWEIAQVFDEQAEEGEAFAPFVAYIAAFADKAAFLREVPRLILLHNIHGVDIDPRATQIARLTLWLRAQRAWQEQRIEVADRPLITRSNVVCAEPMPGERELLTEFVDHHFPEVERGLIQQLLEETFDKMQLAGEAGSLLRIEKEIRVAIDQAQEGWQKLAVCQQCLFSPDELTALGQAGSTLNDDLSNLTSDIWGNIEERIYAALRDYSEQAKSTSGVERRLFSEDTAHGFAFIDICCKRYDVVLMNPPFGEPVNKKSSWIKHYKDQPVDLYCLFVSHAIDTLQPNGMTGCITSSSFKTYVDYHKYRSTFLTSGNLNAFVDLGWGVLDNAYVETAAYILVPSKRKNHLATFIDLRGAGNKEAELISAIDVEAYVSYVYWRDPACFELLPDSPLIYWWNEDRLKYFASLPSLGDQCEQIGKGAGPHLIFYRLRWEVPPSEIGLGSRWAPFSNGGPYSPFRRDDNLLLNWASGGLLVKSYILVKYPYLNGSTEWNIQLEEYYGKAGITYGKKTTHFSAQPLTEGSVFSFEGIGIFPKNNEDIEWLTAYLNSTFTGWFLNTTCGLHKNPPYLRKLPLPLLNDSSRERLASLFRAGWEKQYSISCHVETSPVFVSPFREDAWSQEPRVGSDESLEITQILSEIDKLVLDALGIAESDIKKDRDLGADYSPGAKGGDAVPAKYVASITREIADLVSYILGCVFGRWDIRAVVYGGETERHLSPFRVIPVCPPGQLQDEKGLPACALSIDDSYPLRISWGGILVNDPNHQLDIEQLVSAGITCLIGASQRPDACSSLRGKLEALGDTSLRDWLRHPVNFFADHLKRYSKNRRQAPIYWQLSAGSGSYSVWLYYHRFTADTLYQVLGIVKLRLEDAEREIGVLETQGALSMDGAERIQETQTLLQDLRLLKSELDLVAPLWNPNLNDGVIINHAILWRITPHTPWQKKCKECWDKLVGEEYDWAHLAFHLWPERVIRKCQSDRSLAIAHGLEERLWQETSKGNWLPRLVSEAELQALIAEHSTPAVQNALERFLAAPPPVAAARTRAPRASRFSSTSSTHRPRGSARVVDAEASHQTMLVLTAAPAEGLSRNDIASALDVEPSSITPVIKQLKEGGQIEQLGAARGAKYRLTEQGRVILEPEQDA